MRMGDLPLRQRSDALSFIGSMFGASGLYGNDTVPSPVLLQQSGVSTVFFVTLIFAVLFSAPDHTVAEKQA